MKKQFTKIPIFMLLLFFLVKIAGAQTPSYYTGNTNSPSNSFPVNSTTGKSMQSLIAPAEFVGGASGAYFGNIVKFYVQGTANVTPTFSALTVKMGNLIKNKISMHKITMTNSNTNKLAV